MNIVETVPAEDLSTEMLLQITKHGREEKDRLEAIERIVVTELHKRQDEGEDISRTLPYIKEIPYTNREVYYI